MKRRRFQLLTAVFVLVLGPDTDSWAQGVTRIAAETAQRVDALFAPLDNRRSPGCALGVSLAGNLVYSRGYGMSNLEYDVRITPDSIFNVGSISKQFTAFAIELLASEGKLALDDDIRHYLPELQDYRQRITIRHLLTHTSGLRNSQGLLGLAGWRGNDNHTEDDVVKMAARQKSLNFVPGAEYDYSNTNFILLAAIVRRASGQSLREFAQARIFGPLAMRDTHFHDDHTMIVPGRTSAYQPGPGGGWRIGISVSDNVGDTNLFTTVGDLLKWDQNFSDARTDWRVLLDEMQTPGRLNDGRATNYGFGLRVGTYRGLRTVGHSGSDRGYGASVVRFPDQHLAIATLCNRRGIAVIGQVAEIILGPDVLAPLAAAISSAQTGFEAFAGIYWDSLRDNLWTIVMQNGQLTMNGAPLESLGSGRFRVEYEINQPGELPTEVVLPLSYTGLPREVRVTFPFATTLPFATRGFTRVTAPSYPAADLTRYAGEYRSDELDVTYTIVVEKGGLAVLRPKLDRVSLKAVKSDTFTGLTSGGTVTFIRSPSGDVTGLTISTGGTRRLRFTRVGLTSPAQK